MAVQLEHSMSTLGVLLGPRPKYGAKLAMTPTSGMWHKSASAVVIDIRYVSSYREVGKALM